jgi:hypothetical protein
MVCGKAVPKRVWGMLLAGLGGLWGGCVMTPMKLSQSENTKGSRYLISFTTGAFLVNAGMWIVRFGYHTCRLRSCSKGYAALPIFHWKELWIPGMTSGLLWSIGNFFSLITVYYLGQGIGYSMVQSQMLIAGLWDIFYFQETQGIDRICKWLLSSMLTLSGIIQLSYQHVDE